MKIYVYNFADLTLMECLDTCNNPNGLCSINCDETNNTPAVLTIPHTDKGNVKVRGFSDQKMEYVITCHQGSIAAMALNRVGDILATASERGTIIRLWKLSQEKAFNISLLRRGTDKAELNDLQFSKNSNYLAAASDH